MKKNKFLTVVFSCMPGAGQLYQGLYKKGASIMLWFFGIITLSAITNMPELSTVLPVIWFYAFFDAVNRSSYTIEELNEIEDKPFLFSSDSFNDFVKNKHALVGAIVVFIGAFMLFNIFKSQITGLLVLFMPEGVVYDIIYAIPKAVISILIILLGVKLLKGAKAK